MRQPQVEFRLILDHAPMGLKRCSVFVVVFQRVFIDEVVEGLGGIGPSLLPVEVDLHLLKLDHQLFEVVGRSRVERAVCEVEPPRYVLDRRRSRD